MKHTVLILGLLTVLQQCVSIDITWVRSNRTGETEAEACIRENMNPINMDSIPMFWNETVFRQVVTETLGLKVVNSSTNAYGIEGCCAPGLWCRDDGTCFTQGFGAHFSNYGWLPGDSSAHPVYTCTGTFNATTAVISSAVLSNGRLTVSGSNIAILDSTTSAYVYGETCVSVETCNCLSCTGSDTPQCPPGFLCPAKAGFPFCTQICTEEGDAGCPCDQVCRAYLGSEEGTVRICLPPSVSGFIASCKTSNDNFMCSATRAYTADYAAQSSASNSYPVSIMTGSVGAEKTITPATISTGFCSSDADCFDGDLATRDSCNTATKFCVFTPEEGLSSVLYSVAGRKTAFMYYTYYSASAALAQTQADSVAYLLANGAESSNSHKDDYPFQFVQLPFSIVFFGNLISEAYISPNGVVSLPPVRICDKTQCLLFSTSSNLVAPFHADWNPTLSANSLIKYFLQTPSGPAVFGVTGTALHVLYSNVIRFQLKGQTLGTPNTFASSIYSDGSIRLSYIDITTYSTPSDFSGLWGSFVSSYGDTTESTNLLYHNETVPWTQMNSGSEKLYCPLGAAACPLESCVAPRDTLQVRWNGSTTCEALGSNFNLTFACSFAGGINTTVATYHPVSTNSAYSLISCPVPVLGFTNGTVIEVAIVISATRVAGAATVTYIQNINDNEGSKSVFGVYQGANAELARSTLLVRYYPTRTDDTPLCGCNALPAFAGSQCDSLSVCGGRNDTADCAGTPFGRAMKTECDTCSAGMTGITPTFYCDGDDSSNVNIISQTIILLMIICALSFLVVSVTYSVRRMMVLRAITEDAMRFNEAMLAAENALVRRNHMGNARGLTPFECDALGEVEFTLAFYEQHRKEQQKLLHPTDDAALNNTMEAKDVSAVAGDMETGVGATPAACECSICLMDIEVGTKCRALPAPCGHIFHVECIDQWFAQSYQCPLCKRSVRAMLLGNDEPEPVEVEQVHTEVHFVNGNISVRFIPMRSNTATQARGRFIAPAIITGSSSSGQSSPRQQQQVRRHVGDVNPSNNNLWGAQRQSPSHTHLRDASPVPASRGHTTRPVPSGVARSDVHYQEMAHSDGSADSMDSP